MNKYSLIANVTGPWKVQGNDMVAPVTMMVEGVHEGSHGAIYWPMHVLRNVAHKWEGIAVTLDHPKVDGQYVSVNYNAEVQRKYIIGRVTNPRFDERNKALKAKIHVNRNHPQIGQIQNIREVSCGVFGDETYQPGTWQNEQYYLCAISQEPDHLALLIEAEGACSWEDGCGIRANSAALQEIIINAAREVLQTKDANFFNKLFRRGENNMDREVEVLLPTDVLANVKGEDAKTRADKLLALQKAADEQGILLPTELNVSVRDKQGEGDSEFQGEVAPLLLPPELL